VPDAENRNLSASAASNMTVTPAGDYVWTLMPEYNDADGLNCLGSFTSPVVVIDINGSIYGFVDAPYSVKSRKLNNTTKQWETFSQTVSTSMETALNRTNYLFSHGDKMYSGLWQPGNVGYGTWDGVVYTVNQNTGTLAEVAPFPGTGTIGYSSFSIGNKGYVMGGFTTSLQMSQQFWEYDFDTNVWTDKGTMPGGARAEGSVFVVGNEVYFGLGITRFINGELNNPSYSTEWIKFNPANPTDYTRLQSFPGARRRGAKGFVLNRKVYLGWGHGPTNIGLNERPDDFWEFNPSKNVWIKKANVPGNIGQNASNRAAFVQGSAGYMVVGCLTSLWRYSNTSLVPVPPSGTGPVVVSTNP
jgi:hypothetical protein